MFNFNSIFYSAKAKQDFAESKNVLKLQYNVMTSPYYSAAYQGWAVAHVFGHGLSALQNIGRFLKGFPVLIHACFEETGLSGLDIAFAMGKELGSLAVNLVNTFVSLFSLLFRTISSSIYGYSNPQNKYTLDDIDEVLGKGLKGLAEEEAMCPDAELTRYTFS
jgi:hypothetical protein